LRALLIGVLALATGTAVAQTGLIGFVGLVAPHLARSLARCTHGPLVLLSTLTGGLLLMAADIAARVLIAPQELPVGVLTAVLGGLYLLWLMMNPRWQRTRARGRMAGAVNGVRAHGLLRASEHRFACRLTCPRDDGSHRPSPHPARHRAAPVRRAAGRRRRPQRRRQVDPAARAGRPAADGDGQDWLLGRPLHDWPARERAAQLAWLGQAEGGADDLLAEDVAMLGRLPHRPWLARPRGRPRRRRRRRCTPCRPGSCAGAAWASCRRRAPARAAGARCWPCRRPCC
jgi:hypothetical protein